MIGKIVLACFAFAILLMLLACTAEGYLRQREKNRARRCHDVKRVPLEKPGR